MSSTCYNIESKEDIRHPFYPCKLTLYKHEDGKPHTFSSPEEYDESIDTFSSVAERIIFIHSFIFFDHENLKKKKMPIVTWDTVVDYRQRLYHGITPSSSSFSYTSGYKRDLVDWNYAKFAQNTALLKEFVTTQGLMNYIHPTDSVHGTPQSNGTISSSKGLNLWGKALDEVLCRFKMPCTCGKAQYEHILEPIPDHTFNAK